MLSLGVSIGLQRESKSDVTFFILSFIDLIELVRLIFVNMPMACLFVVRGGSACDSFAKTNVWS